MKSNRIIRKTYIYYILCERTSITITKNHIQKQFCEALIDIFFFIGLVICNWAVLLSILITIWCTFDAAGRSWVKMKKYQRSMRESESRFNYKRSGSMNRNWRQRSAHSHSLSLYLSLIFYIILHNRMSCGCCVYFVGFGRILLPHNINTL